MFWSKGPDKPPTSNKESPPESKANDKKDEKDGPEQFDPKALPPREKLPKSLQKLVDKADKEDNFYDEMVSG